MLCYALLHTCTYVQKPSNSDEKQTFIDKNQALLDKLAASDIPSDAPYSINLSWIAQHRIKVATESRGKPMSIVGPCALSFTSARTMEDLIQEAEDEMVRLEEYVDKRLWEADTAELAERIAATIQAAEQQ